MRPNIFDQQKEHIKSLGGKGLPYSKEFCSFITPFVPQYATEEFTDLHWQGKTKPIDFTHEREWRIPQSLDFSYSDVEFIIVSNANEVNEVSEVIKNGCRIKSPSNDRVKIVSGINSDQFVIIENYNNIEKFWPLHITEKNS